MRVVCDNCGASYKIPDSKLTREVNKATCRKCGNTIVIQRPAEPSAAAAAVDNSGEERTLITSAAELERVARARASAPPADDGSMDPRPTQVSPDNSSHEATVPRDDSAAPAPEVAEPAGDRATLVQQPPPEPPPPFVPSAPPPATGARQVPSPLPPPMAAPSAVPSAAAPPAPQRVEPVAPPPVAIQAPTPPPPYVPAASRAAFDPRGDLTFAALLMFLALVGSVLPLVNTLPLLQIPAVNVAGTFLIVLGVVGALLILLTGGRGTRPASVVLGGGGGFFVAVIFAVAHFAAGTFAGAEEAPVAAAPPRAPVAAKPAPAPAPAATPTPPAAPTDAAALASATPAAAPAPAAGATPAAAPAPAAAPSAAAAPAPAAAPAAPAAPAPVAKAPEKSSSSSKSSSPERITPKAEGSSSRTKSAPAEAPPEKSATLDTRVIDTMMKSNKGVKICYIKEQKSSGSLPNNVKVKMTVQPGGNVSSARIPSGEWQGTDFDGCLSSAVKAIQFPPFDGDPLTLTYAFPNF